MWNWLIKQPAKKKYIYTTLKTDRNGPLLYSESCAEDMNSEVWKLLWVVQYSSIFGTYWVETSHLWRRQRWSRDNHAQTHGELRIPYFKSDWVQRRNIIYKLYTWNHNLWLLKIHISGNSYHLWEFCVSTYIPKVKHRAGRPKRALSNDTFIHVAFL